MQAIERLSAVKCVLNNLLFLIVTIGSHPNYLRFCRYNTEPLTRNKYHFQNLSYNRIHDPYAQTECDKLRVEQSPIIDYDYWITLIQRVGLERFTTGYGE